MAIATAGGSPTGYEFDEDDRRAFDRSSQGVAGLLRKAFATGASPILRPNVLYSAPEGDEGTYLPLRVAFKRCEWLADLRDFGVFVLVLLLYMGATSLRIDWWYGHTTLHW